MGVDVTIKPHRDVIVHTRIHFFLAVRGFPVLAQKVCAHKVYMYAWGVPCQSEFDSRFSFSLKKFILPV